MRGHHEKNQTRFYICFALAISGALGVAFAANMFTLFVFYEVLTLSTYPLVTHHGTEEARKAGRVYLGSCMGTSVACFLLRHGLDLPRGGHHRSSGPAASSPAGSRAGTSWSCWRCTPSAPARRR